MTDWRYDEWPSGEPYEWGGAARGSSPYDGIDFHVDLGCGKVKKGRIGIDRYPAPGVNIVMDLGSGEVFAEAPEPGRDAVEQAPDPHIERQLWHRPKFGVPMYAHESEPVEVHRNSDWANGAMRPIDYAYPWNWRLPFLDSSIESIISHHALEHIGEGFIPLIDDVYRVLKPGGIFRAIVPLFPSTAAVQDPDHKRYFMAHDKGDCTFDAFCGTPGDEPNNCWLASFSVPYTKARFEKVDQDQTALDYATLWGPQDARELRVALKAVK